MNPRRKISRWSLVSCPKRGNHAWGKWQRRRPPVHSGAPPVPLVCLTIRGVKDSKMGFLEDACPGMCGHLLLWSEPGVALGHIPSHPIPPHPLGVWAPSITLTLGITAFQRENLLKGQKEEEERLLKAIPLFCFPDGNNWAPVTEFTRYLPHHWLLAMVSHPVLPYPRGLRAGRAVPSPRVVSPCSETFSFVLTNVDGSRKIGYCRRLLVSISPPLHPSLGRWWPCHPIPVVGHDAFCHAQSTALGDMP